MRAYAQVLSRPVVGYLIGSSLLGRLQNGMGVLAVVLFLRAAGAGYGQVGLVSAVFGVATAIGGPLFGRLVDAVGQFWVLVATAFGSAAGFVLLGLAGDDHLGMAVVAVIVAGGATPPLEACLRSLWPDLLDAGDELNTIYSLDAALQEIIFVAGPLLVVGTVALAGPEGSLYAIALLTVAGTLAFAAAPPVRAWRPVPREALTGWAGPLRSAPLRILFVALFWVGGALGVIGIAVVAYAEDLGRDNLSGFLLGANAFGALTGGLVYGARRWPGTSQWRVPLLFAGLALCYWPLVLLPGPVPMGLLAVVSGLFLAPTLACCFVVIGERAPAGTSTEAFSWVVTMFTVGSALGSAVAGRVLQDGGLRPAFVLPAVFAAAGLAVVLASKSFRWSRRVGENGVPGHRAREL